MTNLLLFFLTMVLVLALLVLTLMMVVLMVVMSWLLRLVRRCLISRSEIHFRRRIAHVHRSTCSSESQTFKHAVYNGLFKRNYL